MSRLASAVFAAVMALTASQASAQAMVQQTACSATYTSGAWRLDVDFSDNPYDGPMVRYLYSHEPSGFSLTTMVTRETGPRFGFETAELLDTPEIARYFEDKPRQPRDQDSVFPPSYRGELTFLLVDNSEPWSWISIGELAYGFDPFVQDAAWIFLPGPQQERNRELVGNLTRIPSNDIEITLEFRPEGGPATVLRRVPMSNMGLVELARQSPSYVEGIMERCPAAGGGS